MTTLPKISVFVDGNPLFDQNGNPRPESGSFMLSRRVPRETWEQLRPHAWYMSQEDLDDMDIFDVPPGWRYNLEALRILLRNGYTLQVRDQEVATEADLDAMFSAAGQAAYRERLEAARRAEEEARQAREAAREARGQAYDAWKAERLTGLVQTYVKPDQDLEWERIAYFDGEDTPGAWYTTGDTWYEAEVDGHTVYRCEYGNAVTYYAPQAVVDRWILADWEQKVAELYGGDEAQAARRVLVRHRDHLRGKSYIGSADAHRLVQLLGEEQVAAMARRGTWYIFDASIAWRREGNEYGGSSIDTAEQYGIDYHIMVPCGFVNWGVIPTPELFLVYIDRNTGELVRTNYAYSRVEPLALEELPERERGRLAEKLEKWKAGLL